MTASAPAGRPRALAWIRVGLGVAGLVVLGLLVRGVGVDVVVATLRPALAWLPLLCAVELARIGCESAASYVALGVRASRVPLRTLYRAHLIGQSLSALAPAPRVVNETIKATLIAPFVGGPAATSVGFVNQAATLLAAGWFSIPCGLAIAWLGGAAVWLWACAAHAVVLIACGVALQAATRADGPGRWLVRRFPSLASRQAAFQAQAQETGLMAWGPTAALIASRCAQAAQFGLAALAVGVHATVLSAMAAQGVNLLASAVGVLVPGGLGTTDGAFALAATVLGTTVARATALALLMRCHQLIWVLIASAVALLAPRAG